MILKCYHTLAYYLLFTIHSHIGALKFVTHRWALNTYNLLSALKYCVQILKFLFCDRWVKKFKIKAVSRFVLLINYRTDIIYTLKDKSIELWSSFQVDIFCLNIYFIILKNMFTFWPQRDNSISLSRVQYSINRLSTFIFCTCQVFYFRNLNEAFIKIP